ncbi:Cytochrome b reductase 1 [Homalodisca vitripennis]|nr:Cytochrome b reductase 1 [Homalodisca vitripennis]
MSDILECSQFVVGFFSFIILLCCEGATAAFRAALVPVHASFGVTTLMMAVATCLTGLTQKVYHDVGLGIGPPPIKIHEEEFRVLICHVPSGEGETSSEPASSDSQSKQEWHDLLSRLARTFDTWRAPPTPTVISCSYPINLLIYPCTPES